MAARSIGSGTISFGLVSIPIRLYTATSAKSVSFNMLHKTCGSRLKQQLLCAAEGVPVERSDVIKGFEYARDQYVKFSDEELKSMEAAQWTGFIVIFPLTFVSSAFVPTDTMPEALRVFAENQPLTQVIEAMRSWLVGTPPGDSGLFAFGWCVGIIAVSMPVATWLFRRKALG